MIRRTGRLGLVGLAVAAAGSLALVLVVRGNLGRREVAPASAPTAAAPPADAPAQARKEPLPLFRTAEQKERYYDALLSGERRAAAVLEQALAKARAPGGDASQVAKLEGLRAEYLQRIKRHEADRRL
jgi:hypothetical protein